MGNIVDDECDEKHETGSGQTGHKGVPVAELPDAFSSGDGDEGRGASGRMERSGHKHDGNGRGHGKAGGKPCGLGKEHAHGDARKRRNEVSSHQIARLRQRTLYGPEGQYGRGPEGSDEQRKSGASGHVSFEKGNEGDGNAASQPGEKNLPHAGSGRRCSASAHFFQYVRHVFSRAGRSSGRKEHRGKTAE